VYVGSVVGTTIFKYKANVHCLRQNEVELFDFSISRGFRVSVQKSLSAFVLFCSDHKCENCSASLFTQKRKCTLDMWEDFLLPMPPEISKSCLLFYRALSFWTPGRTICSLPQPLNICLFSESLACWTVDQHSPQTTAEIENKSFRPVCGRF